MNKLERKNINLIIDFDSTFIKDESLEIISNFSVVNKINNSKISSITTDAMNGKINFSEALIERIKLLNANQSHLNILKKELHKKLSPSFKSIKNYIQEHAANIYVVSG